MTEAARNFQQDYWRPPEQQQAGGPSAHAQAITCPQCGNEFVVGARFCHICGNERAPRSVLTERALGRVLHFPRMGESLGLSTAAFLAFILGVVCVVAAIATGFIYSANTVLDWQAVQVWRAQWLLGAVVAFLAGSLLKKVAH